MAELRHALNGADARALRELAQWFRKQAQSCETLAAIAADAERLAVANSRRVKLCKAGRYADAAAAGAPTDMIEGWRALNAERTRRRLLEERNATARLLAVARIPQRRIAAQLGLSLGRVNQILKECAPPPSPSE